MPAKIRLQDRECPLSTTLGLVGEWWTLLILHDAFDGFTRFDQFRSSMGISSSLLTSRLAQLVEHGVLERRQYQTNPPRFEYVLTELGESLRPVVVVLAAWGTSGSIPRRAAWCWWMPRRARRWSRSWWTARPVGESTALISCSPPDQQRARPFAIATRTRRGCGRRPEEQLVHAPRPARSASSRRCAAFHTVASRPTARSSQVHRVLVGRVLPARVTMFRGSEWCERMVRFRWVPTNVGVSWPKACP